LARNRNPFGGPFWGPAPGRIRVVGGGKKKGAVKPGQVGVEKRKASFKRAFPGFFFPPVGTGRKGKSFRGGGRIFGWGGAPWGGGGNEGFAGLSLSGAHSGGLWGAGGGGGGGRWGGGEKGGQKGGGPGTVIVGGGAHWGQNPPGVHMWGAFTIFPPQGRPKRGGGVSVGYGPPGAHFPTPFWPLRGKGGGGGALAAEG